MTRLYGPLARSAVLAAVLAAVLVILSGCGAMQTPSGTISRERAISTSDWHHVATNADRARLRNWWSAWSAALASAHSDGHGAAITAEGALLDPQAALPGPALPPGDYHCRTIKLGRPGASSLASAGLAYVTYPRFACRVTSEGTVLGFTKLTGSQRQSGLIFPDDDRRSVFLGTTALGDEQRPPDYGADAARNAAAWVERIGPQQWRMVFPRPAFESIVDVLELVPVAE